jgi:hypothetical protein
MQMEYGITGDGRREPQWQNTPMGHDIIAAQDHYNDLCDSLVLTLRQLGLSHISQDALEQMVEGISEGLYTETEHSIKRLQNLTGDDYYISPISEDYKNHIAGMMLKLRGVV